MVWVKIDDQFPEHPKVVDRSPIAINLYIAALCYCNRNLTDGYIQKSMIRRLANAPGNVCAKGTEELVTAGLWERAEGGYQVHDFLDYNPSKEQVLEKRARESDRKRKGIREESARNLYGSDEDSAGIPNAPDPVPDPDPLNDGSSSIYETLIPITTGPNSPGNAEHLINYETPRRGRVSKATENGLPSSEELERRRNDPAWDAREH